MRELSQNVHVKFHQCNNMVYMISNEGGLQREYLTYQNHFIMHAKFIYTHSLFSMYIQIAVTHTDRNDKTYVEFMWTAPSMDVGGIQFQ